MAHNPPNPDRFLRNCKSFQAASEVLERYGEIFSPAAIEAINFISLKRSQGYPMAEAVELFETRPMRQRLIPSRW